MRPMSRVKVLLRLCLNLGLVLAVKVAFIVEINGILKLGRLKNLVYWGKLKCSKQEEAKLSFA